ncbi:hypothetical protein [Gilliamella sp. Occ4-3]|uniref:hypothetical protein n=1 Tax=Gilliamella sp. Occ4-3 TaxID=3120254 RepID=UPI00080ED944|nr:hypothetical protein [Gilliamella apicola]OCG72959.1 hypothetical protein A9G44_09130 [Gilliamella apicola]
MIIKLEFHPASEKPKPEDWTKEAILFNKCDGYHLADNIMFNDDGSFDGFYDFMMNRFSDDFYVSWAILPENPIIE